MQKRIHWILSLALLGTPAVGLADEGSATGPSCEQAYAALPTNALQDLLDPEAPLEQRQQALAGYQQLSSMRGCPEFGYTMGLLYRHGEYLPGNLVKQDIAKARQLILPMAEAGYLNAYADLAEMEMRHANAREAMKWTQVYLYFVDKVKLSGDADGDDIQYERSAYNGNLLTRVELIWSRSHPRIPRKSINADFNAYLREHGDAVLQKMQARTQGIGLRFSAQDAFPSQVTADDRPCYVKAIDRIGAASAAWIVEILPSGETGRIVLENFVPKPEVADSMRVCLNDYRFAPFAGDASVTVRIPIVMGSTEGAAIRRKGR